MKITFDQFHSLMKESKIDSLQEPKTKETWTDFEYDKEMSEYGLKIGAVPQFYLDWVAKDKGFYGAMCMFKEDEINNIQLENDKIIVEKINECSIIINIR